MKAPDEQALLDLYTRIESARLPVKDVIIDGVHYTWKPKGCPECLRQDGKHNSRCPFNQSLSKHLKLVSEHPGYLIKARV